MNHEVIYNTYLSVSRGARNQPWRARKDFSDFEKSEEYPYTKKLELFFNKFPQINVKDFFLAPFIVHKDTEYLPISFYTTQKAIATYSIWKKQKLEESPDSESHINDIKRTLKFIATTCINEGISLTEYCHKNSGYTTQPFIDFLANEVNIYVLISLPNFEEQLNILCNQDKQIYLKDLCNNIGRFKSKLFTSSRAKSLIANGLLLINNTTTKKS